VTDREAAHDRWVQAHLFQMRAERRRPRTIISGAGARFRTAAQADRGERVLYGPHGRPVRIIEYEGGNQVEEDEHLHAVVRPHAYFKLSDLQKGA